jgi:poly-gamma-glutamate synthesis protein (capsule biosynthesis protein)
VQPVERIGESFIAYGLGDFLGTATPRAPWPLRIGTLLSVEVGADGETKGQIAGYRIVPFLRERQGRHEMLVALDEAEGSSATKAKRRLAGIFAEGQKPRKSL